MRTISGCLLLLVVASVHEGHSQEHKEPVSASSALNLAAVEEAQRGEYVFYTQSFTDKENKRASYRGSIYGAIQAIEVKDCELKIESIVVDKFSGTVDQRSTGQLQDTYRYSARVFLTPDISTDATVIEGRPAQLGRNTHSVCEEKSWCTFWWIRFHSKRRDIHEKSTVNDALDFDGRVDHLVVPVSSSEAGNRLIESIRSIDCSQSR